jgi:hypothetical protein
MGLDVADFAGRLARGRSESVAASAALADEHTNAPAHEST